MQFLESIGLSEFIAIDLETSGLNPKEDKIIEISAYKFCNGKPIKSFTKLPKEAMLRSIKSRIVIIYLNMH